MDGVGHRQKTSIAYFLPLSNPDQTSKERTFEEDIEMRADDVNEGFEDEEKGQLRNSRVEVAENYEERIDNLKGKLATLLDTMRIPHDVKGYEKSLKSHECHLKKLPKNQGFGFAKSSIYFWRATNRKYEGR